MFDNNEQYSTYYTNQLVTHSNPYYTNQPVAYSDPYNTLQNSSIQPIIFSNPYCSNQPMMFSDVYNNNTNLYNTNQLVPIYRPNPDIYTINNADVATIPQDNFTSVIVADSVNAIDNGITNENSVDIYVGDDQPNTRSRAYGLLCGVLVFCAVVVSIGIYFSVKKAHT